MSCLLISSHVRAAPKKKEFAEQIAPLRKGSIKKDSVLSGPTDFHWKGIHVPL